MDPKPQLPPRVRTTQNLSQSVIGKRQIVWENLKSDERFVKVIKLLYIICGPYKFKKLIEDGFIDRDRIIKRSFSLEDCCSDNKELFEFIKHNYSDFFAVKEFGFSTKTYFSSTIACALHEEFEGFRLGLDGFELETFGGKFSDAGDLIDASMSPELSGIIKRRNEINKKWMLLKRDYRFLNILKIFYKCFTKGWTDLFQELIRYEDNLAKVIFGQHKTLVTVIEDYVSSQEVSYYVAKIFSMYEEIFIPVDNDDYALKPDIRDMFYKLCYINDNEKKGMESYEKIESLLLNTFNDSLLEEDYYPDDMNFSKKTLSNVTLDFMDLSKANFSGATLGADVSLHYCRVDDNTNFHGVVSSDENRTVWFDKVIWSRKDLFPLYHYIAVNESLKQFITFYLSNIQFGIMPKDLFPMIVKNMYKLYLTEMKITEKDTILQNK